MDSVAVIPDHLADSKTWPFDQLYVGSTCLAAWKKHGETTSNRTPEDGETTSTPPEKAGEANSESRTNLPKTDPQYIPLSGETYFPEGSEIDSAEAAQLASRAAGGGENYQVDRINGPGAGKAGKQKKNGAEALAIRGVSFWAKVREISPGWDSLPVQAQLFHFEKAFKSIGSNPNAIDSAELQEAQDYLFSVSDASDEAAVIGHANRLEEAMAIF